MSLSSFCRERGVPSRTGPHENLTDLPTFNRVLFFARLTWGESSMKSASCARSIKLLIAVMACSLIGTVLAPFGGAATSAASLVPNNGPCVKSKPVVKLGLITVFDSPVLHLKDQADAAKASVVA